MKYYPHTSLDIKRMLDKVGLESIEELFSDIPQDKIIENFKLSLHRSEMDVVKILTSISNQNRIFYDKLNFLGAGAYRHFNPSVIDAVISRSEFYTAYTPYQAEASQGILQSIFEFQTLICMITGMDAANASLYDGSTACAEAVTLSVNHTRKNEVLYSKGLHPEYIEVLKTYFKNIDGIVLKEIPLKNGITCTENLEKEISKDTAGVIIQNPNCLGFIEPALKIGKAIKEANKRAVYTIAVTEPHSLGILKNPGKCNADIAVGEAGSFGLPLSYGGPYVGFMAVKSPLVRKIPGRVVGQTTDKEGKRAFCLTLQAREQHIRRSKASSNICTNEALCALAVTVYLSYVGKYGFLELSRLNMEKAHYLKDRLCKISGFDLVYNQSFFNEFTVQCPVDPYKINRYLFQKGIIGGFVTGKWREEWGKYMTFCVTEMNSKKDIDHLVGYIENYCREEVIHHVQ